MTITEKIDEIEKLLNHYAENSYTEDELKELQEKVKEVSGELEADKSKNDTQIINEAKGIDEAAERILEKYAVKSTREAVEPYTGNVDEDAEAVLERITVTEHVDRGYINSHLK